MMYVFNICFFVLVFNLNFVVFFCFSLYFAIVFEYDVLYVGAYVFNMFRCF